MVLVVPAYNFEYICPLNHQMVATNLMIKQKGIGGGDGSIDGDMEEEKKGGSLLNCNGIKKGSPGLGLIAMLDDLPLSLKIMHRPSRAQEELDKALDPTKRNSIINSRLHDFFHKKPEDYDLLIDKSIDKSNDNYGLTSENDGNSVCESNNSSNSLNLLSMSPSDSINFHSHKLVRKKSGEIVKPSIKEGYSGGFRDRRALSLPTTPTYKQVHFGGDDNVKYFKKKDKPQTISVNNSPTLKYTDDYDDDDYDDDDDDDYDNDNDDDFNYDDDEDGYTRTNYDGDVSLKSNSMGNFEIKKGGTKYPFPKKVKLIDWQVKLLNFPPLSYLKKIHEGIPVFLERIFITFDKKYLIGQIAVKNLAFEKHLTVKYSLDNWGTIVELPTTYTTDCPDVLKSHNYDRFEFKIPLETLFNSFNSTKNEIQDSSELSKLKNTFENNYEMCIKYATNNQEYWDNNNNQNYGIKLIKIIKDLSNDSKPLPNKLTTKNSKIQDHFEKPKYSSSYLRRRVSDSDVDKKKEQARIEHEESERLRREKEDAEDAAEEERERQKEKEREIDGKSQNKANEMSLFNTNGHLTDYVKKFSLNSPLLSLQHNSSDSIQNKSTENITKSISLTSNDGLNESDTKNIPTFNHSKSYKELLENYCFFNSNKHSTHNHHGNVDNIHANKDSENNRDNKHDEYNKENSKTVFAVSSFLGS